VLDVQEDRALIITEDVVEQRQYHNELTNVTWECCSLRHYLWNEFLDKFDDFDETRMIITYNKNADNVLYGTKGTIDTPDKFFLLSLEEADYYFDSDSERAAKYKDLVHWWWLRSPGLDREYAAGIDLYGQIHHDGTAVYCCDVAGVRPALWLNLHGGVHYVCFWFYSSQHMEKIAEKVSKALNSEIYDLDCENKYEWSQQKIGEIDVNISRDHTDAPIHSPVLIHFQSGRTLNRERGFEDEQIKSFGEKLSKALQTHIYRGNYTIKSDELLLLEVFEIYNR
jgi:hypothetical protein